MRYCERLAAFSPDAPELVLLHGWGSDSSIWRSLLARLRQYFHLTLLDLPLAAEDPVKRVLPYLPSQAIYLGWSLGGMLACRIAAQYPERVSGLITVASNARFVAAPSWPEAMPEATFAQFAQLLESEPEKALRRFELLQCHGDANSKEVKKVLAKLAEHATPWSRQELGAGLSCLRDWDNRQHLQDICCPALHIFAEADALVPVSATAQIKQLAPQHDVVVMANSGHIPFLSQTEDFLDHVLSFAVSKGLLAASQIQSQPWQQNRSFKKDVARSFSRAAESYDGLAHLQQRVKEQLLALLPQGKSPLVMDLGSGTGHVLAALQAKTQCDSLLAVDIAEGMVRYAKGRYSNLAATHWLCGDAEDLPLADNSLDLIFSNFSLQWCKNLPALYRELARVLQPGGKAFITTLGPQTLFELKAAWQQVDDRVHVNSFPELADVQQAVAGSGLECLALNESEEVVRYQKLSELTRELKGIGAHNVNDGRPSGLTSRGQLRQLQQAYDAFRDESGCLPASYQVWYLQLSKPDV